MVTDDWCPVGGLEPGESFAERSNFPAESLHLVSMSTAQQGGVGPRDRGVGAGGCGVGFVNDERSYVRKLRL